MGLHLFKQTNIKERAKEARYYLTDSFVLVMSLAFIPLTEKVIFYFLFSFFIVGFSFFFLFSDNFHSFIHVFHFQFFLNSLQPYLNVQKTVSLALLRHHTQQIF